MPKTKDTIWLPRLVELDYSPVVGELKEWNRWRKEHRDVPTSSLLSSYFGYGYQSYQKTLLDKINDKEEEEDEDEIAKPFNFKNSALKHGVTNEPKAKESYLTYLQNYERGVKNLKIKFNGEYTTLFKIILDTSKTSVLATPDFIVEVNGEERIVEFKCPYYVVLTKKDSTLSQVALEYSLRYPYGRENSFIQSAVYAMLYNCKDFHTVYYFGNDADEEIIIIYKYILLGDVVEDIIEAITQTEKDLNTLKTEKNVKFRSKTTLRKKIHKQMQDQFVERIIYFPNSNTIFSLPEVSDLQEKSPNDST